MLHVCAMSRTFRRDKDSLYCSSALSSFDGVAPNMSSTLTIKPSSSSMLAMSNADAPSSARATFGSAPSMEHQVTGASSHSAQIQGNLRTAYYGTSTLKRYRTCCEERYAFWKPFLCRNEQGSCTLDLNIWIRFGLKWLSKECRAPHNS